MAKIIKLIKKMQENQKDWRIEQLIMLANYYDINVRRGKGSHVVFEHDDWVDLLCVPEHRPIKPIYVKKFVAMINLLECKKL